MSLIGARLAFRRPMRQSLIGLIPVIPSVGDEDYTPVPLTTCIDVTAAPYNCVHDASAAPSTTVLDANRTGLQAAIDAAIAAGGAKICIPAGYDIPYNRSPTSGHTWGLRIPSTNTYEISFCGEGATLRASRATGTSQFEGIRVLGTGPVRFHGITFSQRGMGTSVEQQHMVQLGDGSSYGARDVLFQNCRFVNGVGGDGIRLIGSGTTDTSLVQDVMIAACRFDACDRSGVSVQRGVRRVTITGCNFSGSGDQEIDFEPTGSGTLGEFVISNNVITSTNASALAVTLVGQGGVEDDYNNRSAFVNNVVTGKIMARKLKHCTISGNRVNTTATNGAEGSIFLSNVCEDVDVSGNYVRRASGVTAGECISVVYDSEAQPKNVNILFNTVVQETEAIAVKIDSVDGFEVVGNVVKAAMTTTSFGGIIVANDGASVANFPNAGIVAMNSVINTGAGLGSSGIGFIGDATYPAKRCVITENYVGNWTYGIRLQARSGTVPTAFVSLPLIDSNDTVGCTNPLPTNPFRVGGNQGDTIIVRGSGTPEAVITAPVGSIYYNTAAGTVYRKTSGTGNTGWVTP